MRYILKNPNPPQILISFIQQQIAIPSVPTYSGFREKQQMNDLLRLEQKYLCCYCQKPINHYDGDKEAGSHNEHLIPQRGIHGDPTRQLDYYNIYACCNYTKDFTPSLTHCGEAKREELISPFIQQEDCSNFFRYNLIGEILPNGHLDTYQEYKDNRAELQGVILDALTTIEVLNLNCATLVEERKKYAQDAYRLSQSFTRIQAEHKINQLLNYNPLPSFVEVFIYYLKLI